MATASSRYTVLSRSRETVLRQARAAAKLTIPGLIPEQGSSDPHDVTVQPYSSLGARGVNNVSAKLLVTLFPPQRPFFRLDVDPDTADQMGAALGEAQAALAGISRKAMILAEGSDSRPLWMEVFRHLTVAGNVLVYHPDDGSTMRIWRLDQYVVRRDAQGKLIEAVIEEEVYPSELTPEVLSACGLDKEAKAVTDAQAADATPPTDEETKVKLYTYITREGDNLVHYQELNSAEVPQSRGQAKADVAGWQALRWQAVPGSDYGRSFVTEYAGDFLSLEDGMKAVLQFAAEAARILRIVDPNAGIDVEELAGAESGDFLTGFADKINTLQLEKSADFNVLWQVVQSIVQRISQAFLLTANTIRDAERVTAEEIRAIALELEDSFGGTYTVLSSEAQAPYARRLLYILSKTKKAPKLPKSVTPVIVTGFSALGENHEVAAIQEWATWFVSTFGPQAAASLDLQEIALRTGTGRGIDSVEKLLKSPEQMQAEQTNAVAGQAAIAAVPPLAKAAGDLVTQSQGAPSGGQ